MLDSIEYAQLIQQAMLPPPEVLEQALGDYFLIWKPRDLVGGDFYYCRIDEQGGLLAVVDCTGHGVPGAFMTMAVNAVLNHVTSALCADDPARILQEVHGLLRATLNRDDRSEAFENGLDAGICYRSWSKPGLCFAGARFDLFYQDAGETPLVVVAGDSHSLGYRRSDSDWTFRNHWIEAPAGRIFYLTSDGLLDQAGGPKGYGFGKRRFQAALQKQRDESLTVQREILEQTLADWQGDRPQRDDITVLGFRLENERSGR
ncbi:MAG: SpoIIE family protein phosphatase [Candidatus Competibacteraceae bacterium]|nr:SpoIIE family protein phosphatase [Candidatus Competibacteraceae bacterium]